MVRKSVSLEHNPLLGGPSLQLRNRTGNPYREISLSEIDVDPDQPRRVFDPDALQELSESIRQYGVLSPILVRPAEGGTFRLIAGERRLRASMLAGLKSIPAVIDQNEDEGSSSILPKQLVENLQRQDLSSLERAVAIGQLKTKFSWSVREIASKLGVSKSLVQRSIDILALPEDLQAALAGGAAESKILLLANVEDPEVRRQMLAQLDVYSREQLAEEIGKTGVKLGTGLSVSHGGTLKVDGKSPELSVEDSRIVDDLQRALGSRVALARSSRKPDGGKISIEFYGRDDLYEIYRRLVGS